jgi:hypothetical protein
MALNSPAGNAADNRDPFAGATHASKDQGLDHIAQGPVAVTGLVDRAREFASAAHGAVGQLRKYSGQPYEEHLRRVAELVADVTDDAEMIAAAWLHDVVEDTPTTIEEIERRFGPGVRALVDALTDVSRPQDGNRAARKALDRAHLAKAPARAQTVKLADLIDNCQDICKHNLRFGRVFVGEMAGLLGVLTAGDETLRKRAHKTLDKWSSRVARPAPAVDGAPTESPLAALPQQYRRAVRHFTRGFCAEDVAEPLRSFDAATDVAQARDLTACPVVGVRTAGVVTAYAARTELGQGSFTQVMRPFQRTQLLDRDASLVDVVSALGRHEACFIRLHGEVVAYVSRRELQGPVARMWLFGMITSIELAVTEGIRASLTEKDWAGMITSARLDKARALQESRAAFGRPVPLLDCLQLSDKVRILLAVDKRPRALFHANSKAESQRLVRDLEDLRNSLAHAQDIVTHDWTEIARLARRIEELARGSN